MIDPKAEFGRRWSPYTYAFDNSIPDGMWPKWPSMADVKKTYSSTVSSVSKTYNKAGMATARALIQTQSTIFKAGGLLKNGQLKIKKPY